MTGCCLCTAASYLGFAVALWTATKVARWTYNNFFASNNLLKKYKKAGKWAVVTGASDGIGLAMALDLAKRGFSVVLMARTKSKLDDVAAKITEHKGEAMVIPFDFSTAGDKEYNAMFKQLDTIEIAMLINNVGINYECPTEYDTVSIETDLRILKVNCESQLRMTKYVAEKLKVKKAGGIVSLSSISANVPTPMLSTYAATKSFNGHFSRSLQLELAPYNVDVLTVTPGFVCSNMSGRKRPAFDCPSAKQMAYMTLNKVGIVSETHGHRHHDVIFGAVVEKLVPGFLLGPKTLSMNKVVEKKFHKKKEREAAAAKAAKQ